MASTEKPNPKPKLKPNLESRSPPKSRPTFDDTRPIKLSNGDDLTKRRKMTTTSIDPERRRSHNGFEKLNKGSGEDSNKSGVEKVRFEKFDRNDSGRSAEKRELERVVTVERVVKVKSVCRGGADVGVSKGLGRSVERSGEKERRLGTEKVKFGKKIVTLVDSSSKGGSSPVKKRVASVSPEKSGEKAKHFATEEVKFEKKTEKPVDSSSKGGSSTVKKKAASVLPEKGGSSGVTGKRKAHGSLMCHQCQRNDKGAVVYCYNCNAKRYCYPCLEKW